tara:strand:+ start:1087 stop:1875 length:789 start_codon:yes stop_codon:yes gene_type:complete
MSDEHIYHRFIDGEGPCIVLIHGMACDHTDWRLQEAHFTAQGRQMLLMDLRGHGQSLHIRDNLDMPTMAADVVALLHHYDVQSAIVAGHSMGCRVATETALKAPGIIEKVVLVDGSRFAEGDPDEAVAAARAVIEKRGFGNHIKANFASMFLDDGPTELSQPIMDRTAAWPDEVGEQVMLAMIRWDAGDFGCRYSALKTPVSVLQSTHMADGKRSVVVESTHVGWHDQIAAAGVSADIQSVYECGHFTMLEAAEQTNNALAA